MDKTSLGHHLRRVAIMTLKGAKVTNDTNPEIIAEIGILIYPDCQLAAVHGLTDLFHIACEWPVSDSSQERRKTIRVSHWQGALASEQGIEARPRCVWDSHPDLPNRLDYVITPPSIVLPQMMQPMPITAQWLKEQHDAGSRVCSVCAGAFVLAESGLLNGRRATTHWAFARELADQFPSIDIAQENMVIDDGDVLTAGGMLAWTDLGLTLVDRLIGPSAMFSTARFLVVDPPRNQQLPFSQFIPRFDHGDLDIVTIQHRLHAESAQPQTIDELSSHAGCTKRTFLRRFTKATGFRPTEYLQNVRIAKAREYLETTNRPIEQIASQVGYVDPAAFRKMFHRLTSLSPNLYRKRFGATKR